jgi:hypothetical protein
VCLAAALLAVAGAARAEPMPVSLERLLAQATDVVIGRVAKVVVVAAEITDPELEDLRR